MDYENFGDPPDNCMELRYSTLVRYREAFKSINNPYYDYDKAIFIFTKENRLYILEPNAKWTDITDIGRDFEKETKDTLIFIIKDPITQKERVKNYYVKNSITNISTDDKHITVYENGEEVPFYLHFSGRKSSLNYEIICKNY